MDVRIQTIPHAAQRYPTVGDWYFKHQNILKINVSEFEQRDYEFLIMVHELIEAYLCLVRGVSEEEVDKFDKTFKGLGEAGNDPAAPYHKEHLFATSIEKLLAAELEMDWEEYDKFIDDFTASKDSGWVQP